MYLDWRLMLMTQCDRIIQYINDFGSISTLEAFYEFGCMRLAARIADLREKGYSIVSETVTAKNRYGEPVSYSRYRWGEDNG